MALQPWRIGKVIRISDHTHNTRQFWVEIPELDAFDFKPGQFVTIDLPIHEKPNKRIRSYSIASWPDGSNVFELLIVLAEHGLGTHFLFDKISVGDELTLRGAQGVFVLPEKLEKDIYLICTGTGIAPFRSMINYIHLHNIPFKNIHLIFGCRKKGDLLYHEELIELEKRLPRFHYHPTLSREEWEGHHGYVHPIYEELCKDKPEALFFICGWKAMIDEAKKRIVEMGYDKKSIHQELYG
ncbi:MAG: FAD-dependent oxidoreductase [Chitinophagaceae bacterium]|nr:FAD-dependent oxidoreductase [Chitinophagaceae bacterium]MBP9105017.1 FAD-dependent oxidoreductase [Chitinophagaceae bacterium]